MDESPAEAGVATVPVSTAAAGKLALAFHAAYCKPPPSIPSPQVMENVKELLRQGRLPEQLTALAAWCESTSYKYKPQCPQNATNPERYEQWIESMKQSVASTKPKNRGPNI